MVESAGFWDKVADKYAARPVADQDAYQEKLELTQRFFNSQMDVLEFGCGTGSTALVHAPYVASYTAIDISKRMIEIAISKRAQQQNEQADLNNLHFRVATLDDYASVEETYDAVLGLSILHLLPNYQQAICQSYNMLKPGGIMVTNTGCLKDHLAFMRFVIPLMQFFGIAPHVEFLSRAQINQSMQCAGFDIEYSWVPPKSKSSYFMICRKPG